MNNNQNYTIKYTVDQTPEKVFEAINSPSKWWEEIQGKVDALGAEFVHQYKTAHYCKLKVTEFVPGKKVVWHVLENNFSFTNEQTEWTGTDIVFEIEKKDDKTEIRFTHVGLVPRLECYNSCVGAWTELILGNLRNVITSQETKA